jgi:hypothetical protein
MYIVVLEIFHYSVSSTTVITMAEQLFGLVIPGRPLVTTFQVLDSTKAVSLLDNPGTVNELTFFLLPSNSNIIPPGYGAILYYSIPPFQNWVLIGSVCNEKPSGIFRTSWSTNEEVRLQPLVQIGVALEP